MKNKILIAEQQKALSESHILMFDEKLHELQLLKDNEELRKVDEKDCMKIKELMKLADEVRTDNDPHTVKVSDSRPKDSRKESLAIERNTKSKKESRQTYASKYKQSMKVCKNQQSGKVKVIFLPHEDVNRLRLQIDRLREYKNEQRNLYQHCLSAYDKDKTIKTEEIKLRKKDFEAKYQQLQEIVARRNAQKEAICRAYFQERHKIKEKSNPSVEAFSERLKTTKQILEKKLDDEKLRLEREVAYKVEVLEQNTEDYMNKFRSQAIKKENKVNILRDQYIHLQKVYVENLKTLEFELESYLQREENIEFRRQREFSTFNEDIIAIKKRIADYEVYVKKLKDLVDHDNADGLIEELNQYNVKRKELLDIKEEITKLKAEVDNARKVKV